MAVLIKDYEHIVYILLAITVLRELHGHLNKILVRIMSNI